MASARKGRDGRLTIVHPSLGDLNVPVREKGKSDESPEINITTTESPVPGEAEYDDEGGLPNRELTFTIRWDKGKAQPFYNGEAYDFKNYVGSKTADDMEQGRLFIRSVNTVGEQAEGDSIVELEYSCRVSNFVKAPRPFTEI